MMTNQAIRKNRQAALTNLKNELGFGVNKPKPKPATIEKSQNDVANAVSAHNDFAKAIADHVAAQKAKAAQSTASEAKPE